MHRGIISPCTKKVVLIYTNFSQTIMALFDKLVHLVHNLPVDGITIQFYFTHWLN
jgi:hypothetical protein